MIGVIAVLTYIISTIFAIAGMGAAGVLIPNYIALGIGVRAAIMLGLTQNVAELTIVSALNGRKRLVEWRKVLVMIMAALPFIPVGAYIDLNIPRIVILTTFALFLLFALYRITNPSKNNGSKKETIVVPLILGSLQGFIGGLIGMDAAPIALIAYTYFFSDPKKISANTAASALGVSTTALLTYLVLGGLPNIEWTSLVIVGLAGLLGGVTGSSLMHRANIVYVKYTIVAVLGFAFAEITAKTLFMYGMVEPQLYDASVLLILIGLGLFAAKTVRTRITMYKIQQKAISDGKTAS
jgi:uncharacterized membrane protein YfcA